jgi:hypothetical protein
VILATVALAAALTSPTPTATPVQTVFLTYNTPSHGYTSHYVATGGSQTITVDESVDAYNNREADIGLEAGPNSFKHHYMLMDGLLYVRGNDGMWQLDAGAEAPVLTATMVIAGYWPPAVFRSAAVSTQGTGPCGNSTCSLYLASLATTKGDKPEAQVSHLAIDQTSRLLVSAQLTMFDASGAKLRDSNAQFGGFEGQHLTVPVVAPNPAEKSQCNDATFGSDHLELCLIRGPLYPAMYTLRIGETLVMRAGGSAASTGQTSPVRDDVFLKCQIEPQLDEAQTASDCTVTIGDQPALVAHYDFK